MNATRAATRKLRARIGASGGARRAVGAAPCKWASDRRARSDAPDPAAEAAGQGTRLPRRMLVLVVPLLLLLGGCGQSKVNQALDSDANGYLCLGCKTKFYTARDLFADYCPQCKQANIQPVVGFVCEADQHVTLAPRGRGFHPCAKCGRATSALKIPRESDLTTWGAVKKTRQEVCGY